VTPDRRRFDPATCSIAATLGVIGEKWTLLVLREAFYGQRRHDDILEAVGCARNLLADRLRTLVDHQLLQRTAYRAAGQRERFEYRLTPRALELFPVLVALMQWGDRWLAPGGQPPVVLEHRGCAAAVHAELRCAAGHGQLTARDTAPAVGPGARPRHRPRRLGHIATRKPTVSSRKVGAKLPRA
jgi:DNA-binding HxlR family transcriptional regulator